jgi:hypothetical protein
VVAKERFGRGGRKRGWVGRGEGMLGVERGIWIWLTFSNLSRTHWDSPKPEHPLLPPTATADVLMAENHLKLPESAKTWLRAFSTKYLGQLVGTSRL